MEELINLMSNSDLGAMKGKYADNPSVVTLIDGILESRAKAEVEAKAKAKFEKGIANLFKNLPHPEDINNVYVRWGEVDIPDGEPEEVEVDGEKVMRTPCHKEYQWVVQVNKAVVIQRGASGNGSKVSKRAITVMKRNGLNLQPIGNFISASKACEYLKLTIGGDSATRVLEREGYIREAYEGNEYTS